MQQDKIYYTYAHYTPQGTVFYIGKGHGNRAYSKHGRNNYWQKTVAKYGAPVVQILETWVSEKEAFTHEISLIAQYKGLGYKLCNLSDGGEGPSGLKHTNEVKQKLKEFHTGNTWRKGHRHTEERKLQIGQFFRGSKFTLGNTNARKWKWIGTHVKTNEYISFIGTEELNAAGFQHANVIKCINGSRKTHKEYVWHREYIKE